MSMDELFFGAAIPDRGKEYRPLSQLRWLDGKLQQMWAPEYGGQAEWRDVPAVVTDGVMVGTIGHVAAPGFGPATDLARAAGVTTPLEGKPDA